MAPIEPESTLRSMTVEQLVLLIREGSKDEASTHFAELIRRFEPLLRRAWRGTLPGTEYEDYAQDVFLIFFRSIQQLRNPKAFPGYFRRIALTVASDHVRKLITQDSPDSTRVESLVDGIDELLFNALFVRSYLEHLPARERQVLGLSYLEEYSLAHISQVMGLSPSAVRSLKVRAIKRLRVLLANDAAFLERRTPARPKK